MRLASHSTGLEETMTAPALGSTAPILSAEEREFLEALRRGDERADIAIGVALILGIATRFARLPSIDCHTPS